MNFSIDTLPDDLVKISWEIRLGGGYVCLVGGWVRDVLQGRPSQDFDLEVYGLEMEALKGVLGRFGTLKTVGEAFGVVSVHIGGRDFDFALPRIERKNGPGHKGFSVQPDPGLSFEQASMRRDFTINSMGVRIPEMELLDYHGGRRDLEARVLRHVSPAFPEDPLRALRAVQLAARFEFDIDPETQALCRTMPLGELPVERISGEFEKLLLKALRPSIGLEWLRTLEMLGHFPELKALIGVEQDPQWHPEGDVWIHNNMVVDEAARLRREELGASYNLSIMLGALCHDLGKPHCTVFSGGKWRSPGHEEAGEEPTRSFLCRMTKDVELVDTVVTLVRDHLKPSMFYQARHELKPGAIRRLALRVDIEKLVRLARADQWGRTTPQALAREFPAGDWLLEQCRVLNVLEVKPKPFLSGKFLLSLGMKPGPEMGRLIAESFELQLEGEVASVEGVQDWARGKLGSRSA